MRAGREHLVSVRVRVRVRARARARARVRVRVSGRTSHCLAPQSSTGTPRSLSAYVRGEIDR